MGVLIRKANAGRWVKCRRSMASFEGSTSLISPFEDGDYAVVVAHHPRTNMSYFRTRDRNSI
jgi:hypothetical protein